MGATLHRYTNLIAQENLGKLRDTYISHNLECTNSTKTEGSDFYRILWWAFENGSSGWVFHPLLC